ncbi:hypothetical protein HQO42_18890 [Rhodococcus fascians]|nr:hypothetical protein [Rhodococcus fascians]MBY4238687.1 hypothetical protein [Rhodococcus fascians]MBY4254724.1 hypothetical protein [Rhodococcus fascians]MBY4270042.1 hypothetical protein [Rhodococcus fascians]
MKLGLAIRELHRSEHKLARQLSALSARHRVEHEIFYTARDVAMWSREHLADLADAGTRYGLKLSADPHIIADAAGLQQKVSVLLGRRSEPALVLLADLRRVHRTAAGVSLDWELLAQGAQAAKDVGLIELTQRAHPRTLRQMKWANGMLKVLSPQALSS